MAVKTAEKKKIVPRKGHKPMPVQQFAAHVNNKYGEALARLAK